MKSLTQNLEISKFIYDLGCNFSKPQTNHLFTFFEGILNCDKRKNISNILEHSLNQRNRSSFNKFFNNSPWDEADVKNKRKAFSLKELEDSNPIEPIFYSIDDTLITKQTKSKKIEGMMFNHSHVSNKREWSHCQVSLHGYSSGLSLPLEFKTYLNKESCAKQNRGFKGKGELAIKMLGDITSQLKRKCYVLSDSWYMSEDFINKSQKLGFQVISGIKSNRIFYPQGERSKLNEFANDLKEEDLSFVTAYGQKHYIYRYEGPIKGIENIVILISWINEYDGSKKPFYLVTTDTSLTTKEILEYYRNRWEIETSFKYQKDRLGLDQYEMRNLKGIERFWELLYLVYNYLEIKRHKEKTFKILGEFINSLRATRSREIIDYIYDEAKKGTKKEKLYNYLKVSLKN